ncbi:hypothetical protein SMACR_00200 [Sordaria macrospora]|uniref:WGS project CABT00000000 data, contig 2.1 n=2 Tax=Sordaria macrospora TaxID=5147 RepID=F7VKF7_SORMK|nr:uncharacterized protein SMAC_00200 [Sordaria macrospora k-hell]KAA8636773.1 hypothetical protein SMACR_00200 [Sordaria macrospora]WPJ58942.1 hypothetical protein SMAC4_00200 [Sordaria macrospora]CCC05984.1 unnamed protein product [Sordaria macrospora k-hell]
MAPIRRYLRITKYSVLECRIYLDNPALAHSWLLNPRNSILPKVIEAVRPLVLPKLREERERAQSKKKSKKRSIKDVVIEDDFEVSVFLTETDTRHSLLHKQKHFRDKIQTKLKSNSSKLTGESREAPVDVDVEAALLREAADDDDVPIIREENDEDQEVNLNDIPTVDETDVISESANRRSKRRRRQPSGPNNDSGVDDEAQAIDSELLDDDDMFIGDSNDDNGSEGPPARKRRKDKQPAAGEEEGRDDKKKLAMDISYEGFAIYGRVLCLVVKKQDSGRTVTGPSSGKALTAQPGGQAMMENWITSTQLPEAAVGEDDAV